MILKCPLCGYEFDDSMYDCHSGCPMSKNCNAVKCPNCSYEFVEKSDIVEKFKKLFGKK